MKHIPTAYWQLHCSPQPDSACVPGYVMTDWTEEQLDQVTSPTIPSTSLTNPSSAVDRRPQGGRLRQDEPQAEAVIVEGYQVEHSQCSCTDTDCHPESRQRGRRHRGRGQRLACPQEGRHRVCPVQSSVYSHMTLVPYRVAMGITGTEVSKEAADTVSTRLLVLHCTSSTDPAG